MYEIVSVITNTDDLTLQPTVPSIPVGVTTPAQSGFPPQPQAVPVAPAFGQLSESQVRLQLLQQQQLAQQLIIR